jgi:hypothetical protein
MAIKNGMISFKSGLGFAFLKPGYLDPSLVFVLYIGEAFTLSTGPKLVTGPDIDFLPAV